MKIFTKESTILQDGNKQYVCIKFEGGWSIYCEELNSVNEISVKKMFFPDKLFEVFMADKAIEKLSE